MFTTWLTYRQARAALKNGALEEAARLAELRLAAGEARAAWEDLRQAEAAGLADDLAALRVRQELVRHGVQEAADKGLTLTYAGPADRKTPVPVPPADEAAGLRRMLLWIDGVGGYLLCLSPRVSIGQATPDAFVDVPLFADVSRLHAHLTRDGEGYLLEAVRPVRVNQHQTERALLRHGDRVTLGENCQLTFHQPSPVSATARLDLVSRHRLPLSLDGVLLVAETCVLANTAQAHVILPDLPQAVVLFRRKEGLGVRVPGAFTVNGAACQDRANLPPGASVAGPDFRFTLEPVGEQLQTR